VAPKYSQTSQRFIVGLHRQHTTGGDVSRSYVLVWSPHTNRRSMGCAYACCSKPYFRCACARAAGRDKQREITSQSFGRLTAVRRVGPCTRAALWVVKKGRFLGDLDFDKGGHRFLADRVGPPVQSSTQLARSSSAPMPRIRPDRIHQDRQLSL
jgi:hypothetical protein